MNKKQNWILESAYRSEVCVQQVLEKLKLDYDSFYNLVFELEQYASFHRKDRYEDSFITLTPKGEAYVEELIRNRRKAVSEWVRYGITTAIALAAFIKSFFF